MYFGYITLQDYNKLERLIVQDNADEKRPITKDVVVDRSNYINYKTTIPIKFEDHTESTQSVFINMETSHMKVP